MKPLLTTLALLLASFTNWAQTDSDSLKVQAPDSLAAVMPDSLLWEGVDSLLINLPILPDIQYYSSALVQSLSFYFYLPTCKELESKKGLVYYFIEGEAVPYCGQCVETTDNKGVVVLYSEEAAILPDTFWPGTTVKSISTYKDGLRHGSTVHFDKTGKQTKVETYENGKLVTGSR